MRAIIYDKSQAPDPLVLREVLRPLPEDHEVLVKVHAVSINAADYRSMRMGIIPKRRIFGADIAGVVEAVGDGVRGLRVGDAVFGDISASGFGGFAEYAVAAESALALKPAGVSFEDAAAVPMAALTALQALRKGELQPGKKVLVCGAGGGVGTFAVQLARQLGAQVTALCGPRNVERMRQLGAEHVLDYTQQDFTQSGERYDLILGVNGNYSLSDYRRALAPRGVYVMVGGALSQVFKSMAFGPLMSIGSRKFRTLAARISPQDLEYVIQLVEQGKVRPVIDRTCRLEQIPEAMKYLGAGHAAGKVVVQVVE